MRQGSRFSGIGRVLLLPPAAFAVHQLRYELAYGSRASAELHATGHSYLHSVVPWLVALVGIAVGLFLLNVGRAFRSRTSTGGSSVSLCAMWALCAVALIAVFACQETLEGIFATGHPSGWTGVFGDGGWWAVPVAAGIGLALAAIFHGASWIVRRTARWRRRPSRPRRAITPVRQPAVAWTRTPTPVLAGWSCRGPPA